MICTFFRPTRSIYFVATTQIGMELGNESSKKYEKTDRIRKKYEIQLNKMLIKIKCK